MLGHHLLASKMPFKWRFAGGAMMARFKWYLDPLAPHQLKKTRQNWSPLAKFSGSVHEFHH